MRCGEGAPGWGAIVPRGSEVTVPSTLWEGGTACRGAPRLRGLGPLFTPPTPLMFGWMCVMGGWDRGCTGPTWAPTVTSAGQLGDLGPLTVPLQLGAERLTARQLRGLGST